MLAKKHVQGLVSRQAPRQSRQGFTLVELLVVIGIISLLISILLPSLARARRAANAVVCSSQMRQLGLAIQMYANDSKGSLPAGYINLPTNGWVHSWEDMTYEYYASATMEKYQYDWVVSKFDIPLLRCPEDQTIPVVAWIGADKKRKTYALVRNADFATAPNVLGRNVCMTSGLNADGTIKNTNFKFIKLTEARDAAGTLLLAEQVHEQNIIGYGGLSVADNPQTQLSVVPDGLHLQKKFNYLFCDGHVEALSAMETFGTGTWDNPRGMWTLAVGD